jgi:hypothetical protein
MLNKAAGRCMSFIYAWGKLLKKHQTQEIESFDFFEIFEIFF